MLTLRRKSSKTTAESKAYIKQRSKDLECSVCAELVCDVAPDAARVICPDCVQRMVPPPENPKTKHEPEEKHPRGWHFRAEYISPSGKRYRFGKEVASDEVAREDKAVLHGKSRKSSNTGEKNTRTRGRKRKNTK